MHRLSLLLLCAALPSTALAAPKGVQPEDLFRLTLVSQSQIAPDGKALAYVLRRADGPTNDYRSDIWVVGSDGRNARPVTHDGASTGPRWSPDGASLAFVRKVAGKPQIVELTLKDASEHQLTALAEGAQDPVWSHDGHRIAFAALSVEKPPPARIDFAAAGFQPSEKQAVSDIRVIDVERYEANGVGYTYDKHSQVWTMNADGSSQTPAIRNDRGSEDQFAWSPDDRTIAFTSQHDGLAQAGKGDIYVVATSAGDPVRLKSAKGANTQPTFLHDGRLAYFAADVGDSAEYPALMVSLPDGGGAKVIVERDKLAWGDAVLADQRMPDGPCGPLIAPSQDRLITNVTTPGSAGLVSVNLHSGAITPIGPREGESYGCSLSADGKTLGFIFSDFMHPAEAHVLNLATGENRTVTSVNQAYLATVQLSKPEKLTVRDAKGFDVEAWFMPALGAPAGTRRPTLVDIHGGPQTEFGSTFFHEMQFWAGRGYNVVIFNPEGSVGYGHAFEQALEGDWGAPMFDDVTRVMDEVVRRPDVDSAHLGVIGGSYGGYAALWIISHTDRFAAAVSERPASDLATQGLDWYLASSNGLGGEYAWGKPWDPKSRNFVDSPLTYVESVHTPVMLLHSDEDTETPLDQTLDEFSALKQLGREAVFVDVPNENHDLNRVGSPIHRVERLRILAEWFAGVFARPHTSAALSDVVSPGYWRP